MIRAVRRKAAYALLVWVFFAGGAPQAGAAESLSDLTGPWHLFVDDYPVAEKTGVVRTYHPFQKYAGNPVMVADRPWEGANIYLYGTVLPAESGPGYRMWYQCLNFDPGGGVRGLYATSPDGIHWTKPNLGNVSFNGSTDNNILMPISCFPSVMHTPWEESIGRPYHMMRLCGSNGAGYYGAWSPDGTHWTEAPGNPVAPMAGDVANFVWDPHTQQYIGYPKVGGSTNGTYRRSVGFTATSNFESWPAATLILEPDTFDDRWVTPGLDQRTHFYGLSGFAYESMYLGFLWILRSYEKISGADNGPIFVEIVSSHDGIHWTREEGDRPPILPVGPAGAWDDGMVLTSTHPLVEGDTIRLYYGGFDGLHAEEGTWHGSIGFATLRKDGFGSLDAAGAGTVTTQRIDGVSGPLRVNFSAPNGWIKAEVLDAEGNVLPGYGQAECNAVTGDWVDQAITWASRSELPAGAGFVRIRFLLQNASLYSFAAGDSAVIIELPSVTRQPTGRSLAPGGSASFSIRATGTRPLQYQWQKNGLNLTDNGHYSGTLTPTLTIVNTNLDDSAYYRCVVTNRYGGTVSNAAALSVMTAGFTGIGALSGSTSSVTGITADGGVVCGASGGRAILWSAEHGFRDIGLPADATSASAAGVGRLNGQLVVAVNTNASDFRAKRWDGDALGNGSYTNLPKMGGTLEWLTRGLGTNGTSDVWIAGSSFNGGDGNGRQAGLYRQSLNNTVLLGLPPSGHDHSDANAVADNGYVTGQYQHLGSAPTGGARNAMKSVNGSTSTALNSLFGAPSTAYEAIAKAISRDGLTQGGWSHYSGGGSLGKPVVWRNSVTPTAAPFIAGGDNDNHGEVLAVNGNGTLAGGYSQNGTSNPVGPKEAFLWDATNGTRQLQGMLTNQYGLDLSAWALQEVRAISSDGMVIAGNGLHNGTSEGWVVTFINTAPPAQPATVPADLDQDGDVDGTDYGAFAACFNGTGRAATAACFSADVNGDNYVDGADLGVFSACFNGSGNPPACS